MTHRIQHRLWLWLREYNRTLDCNMATWQAHLDAWYDLDRLKPERFRIDSS